MWECCGYIARCNWKSGKQQIIQTEAREGEARTTASFPSSTPENTSRDEMHRKRFGDLRLKIAHIFMSKVSQNYTEKHEILPTSKQTDQTPLS